MLLKKHKNQLKLLEISEWKELYINKANTSGKILPRDQKMWLKFIVFSTATYHLNEPQFY